MSFTNLKQNDGRWAAYPYAGETMGPAGCGPTSCADILGQDTPVIAADWMTRHGYASNGSGTYHAGITAYLRNYGGLATNQITPVSMAGVMTSEIFDSFKAWIQSGNVGIVLFGGVATGCKDNYWSRGGHYCACVGYKDGKYLIYDPAWAARDGYHSWSDLAGDIKHLWTIGKNWKKESEGYTLTLANLKIGDTGNDVKALQRMLIGWGYDLAVDGSFGTKTKKAVVSFQKAHGMAGDGIVGTNTYNRLFYRV